MLDRTRDENDSDRPFAVVINEEEQYALWPAVRPAPAGWRDTGVRGTKDICLAYVEDVWTDMRPKRLRAPRA